MCLCVCVLTSFTIGSKRLQKVERHLNSVYHEIVTVKRQSNQCDGDGEKSKLTKAGQLKVKFSFAFGKIKFQK